MINLFELPNVKFSELKSLPHVAAVYLAVNKSNFVLYVGQSKNINQRWKAHHKISDLEFSDCTKIAWIATDIHSLITTERKAIRQFKPLLNGSSTSTNNDFSDEMSNEVDHLYEKAKKLDLICKSHSTIRASQELSTIKTLAAKDAGEAFYNLRQLYWQTYHCGVQTGWKNYINDLEHLDCEYGELKGTSYRTVCIYISIYTYWSKISEYDLHNTKSYTEIVKVLLPKIKRELTVAKKLVFDAFVEEFKPIIKYKYSTHRNYNKDFNLVDNKVTFYLHLLNTISLLNTLIDLYWHTTR